MIGKINVNFFILYFKILDKSDSGSGVLKLKALNNSNNNNDDDDGQNSSIDVAEKYGINYNYDTLIDEKCDNNKSSKQNS